MTHCNTGDNRLYRTPSATSSTSRPHRSVVLDTVEPTRTTLSGLDRRVITDLSVVGQGLGRVGEASEDSDRPAASPAAGPAARGQTPRRVLARRRRRDRDDKGGDHCVSWGGEGAQTTEAILSTERPITSPTSELRIHDGEPFCLTEL